jgi:hypothetical protein
MIHGGVIPAPRSLSYNEAAMPILIAIIFLCAVIYGAIRAFNALDTQFGIALALGAAALVALLLAALAARLLRRHRDIAPNAGPGTWTHVLERGWGSLRFSAPQRLMMVTLNAVTGNYIFADLTGASVQHADRSWSVAVTVNDRAHPQWILPMESEREAKRWTRVIELAIAQKLPGR